MDSPTGRHGQPDATAREAVYCHACGHEWPRDEHGLVCPRCHSEATEIIEDGYHPSASTSPETPPYRHRDHPDPDEADIEEHLGPQGFTYRRDTRHDFEADHHNPGIEPVLERFVDMLHTFGPPRRYGPGGQMPLHADHPGRFGEPRIQRATFTSNTLGGGTASVTIFSGPARGFDDGFHGDPFQAIFSNALRGTGPPHVHTEAGGAARPTPNFTQSLQDILSLFNSGSGISGDAVYTQEALDRIISNLMEANPQSNAAPPASQQALEKLERRVVDEELRGREENFECAVCIDEMKVGDSVVFLPCKHIFHEECVVMWLKEHNTCPVCRAPVEKNGPDRDNNSHNTPGADSNAPGGSGSGSGGPGGSDGPPIPGNRPAFAGFGAFGPFSSGGGGSAWSPGPSSHGASVAGSPGERPSLRFSRPPSHSQSALNEAMRSISSRQLNQERERDRDRDRDNGSTSGFSYDTSRLQRRSSMSPTSPRIPPGEQGSRMRQRSPSESASSRRGTREADTQRQSSHNPLSWLRDRFSGSGGPGSSSPRDDGRS